ncbi:MAG: hypothetical protein VKL23_01645 [Cyanobacteriota bacterium]|jgi:hypothetical protein|nr:hypothetical protein [Cyanobacteriota bacterium]
MGRSGSLLPLALAGLALYDLRVDIRLLFDHFTWTSLLAAATTHPLAVAVLVLTPALIRRA